MHLFAGPWLALWGATAAWVAMEEGEGPAAAAGHARERPRAADMCKATGEACLLALLVAVPWGLLVIVTSVLQGEACTVGVCVAVYGAGALLTAIAARTHHRATPPLPVAAVTAV